MFRTYQEEMQPLQASLLALLAQPASPACKHAANAIEKLAASRFHPYAPAGDPEDNDEFAIAVLPPLLGAMACPHASSISAVVGALAAVRPARPAPFVAHAGKLQTAVAGMLSSDEMVRPRRSHPLPFYNRTMCK